MSGEGKSVSFKRTPNTTKSNKELHEEFSKIIFYSPVTRHMKFYGKRWSGHQGTIELYEHGDKSLPKWQQEYVAIKGTFEIGIHLYESWSEDWELIEDENNEGSLVSLAKKFAKDNNLMFFPDGFPFFMGYAVKRMVAWKQFHRPCPMIKALTRYANYG